jgi:putative hemolysin
MLIDTEQLTLKIATTQEELCAAQRLRYRVFVQEMGAKATDQNHSLELERDEFDEDFDHLILVDNARPDITENVVGVYRLLRGDVACQNRGFYSASEYDLSKLIVSDRNVLELGRSCIHPEYRGGVALHMMWNGLAEYVSKKNIEIMFGVASFHGTDPKLISQALSFLHYNHLAPEDLCVTAWPKNNIDMGILSRSEVEKLSALKQLPPLIKAYLRLGGFVGHGACLDEEFNTIDVCLLMDTQRMSAKHKAMYEKGTK